MKAALEAAHEHPSRILVVITAARRGAKPRLDAEVRVGGDAGPGETVVLRLHGELADHADSVVLPLLLPDAPVVVWWPGKAPDIPGRPARRAGAAADHRRVRASSTRIRRWPSAPTVYQRRRHRPVLDAASPVAHDAGGALDQPYARITAGEILAERVLPQRRAARALAGR